jgi:hypothetical protein
VLSGGELEALRSAAARIREKFRGSSDRWVGGLNPFGILRGLCAEQALADFVNAFCGAEVLRVNLALTSGGDGGKDFRVGQVSIQVKARRRGDSLVRRIDRNKNLVPLSAGYYVFAEVYEFGRPELLGYLRQKELLLRGVRIPSSVAEHHNLKVPDERLEPIQRLAVFLREVWINGNRNAVSGQ